MSARDVFICHAHRDKATHARPLARSLAREAVSCWLDEGEIRPGDSLFRAINQGLAGASQVVVLITENFLGRGWTERELEAATSIELEVGETVVVPILAVDRRRLLDRYPLLGGKLSLDWRDGPDSLARDVAASFDRRAARDWVVDHPKNHVGPIWTRVTPERDRWGGSHAVALRWGPFVWRGEVQPVEEPVSLTHHKDLADRVPLLAEVDPPAIITFGQGTSPDATRVEIDEGWVRAAGSPLAAEDRRTRRLDWERSNERRRWLDQLREEYVLTHDGVPAQVVAGTALPPLEWLLRRADELNVAHLFTEMGDT